MERAQWPDPCLGLAKPNESCVAVITRGWRVVFKVSGQSYEGPSVEAGANVGVAEPERVAGSETSLENLQWHLVSLARREQKHI